MTASPSLKRILASVLFSLHALACDDSPGDESKGDAAVDRDDSGDGDASGGRDAGTDMEPDTGVDRGEHAYNPPPDALVQNDQPVAQCDPQLDMQLCQAANAEPHFCKGGSCQPFTCVSQDEACRIPGPYFPFVPQAKRTLTRQGSDEPVIVDSVSTLMFTGCIAGMRGRECDSGTPDWMEVQLEGAMYCANLTWAGHDDWFLPDPWALLSLTVGEGEHVEFAGELASVPATLSDADYAIPWRLIPDAPSGSQRPELLSSFNDEIFGRPTVLLSGSGIMDSQGFAHAICVRLTKGTTPLPQPRNALQFYSPSDRLAFDRATHQMWFVPGLFSDQVFPTADQLCADLVAGGFDDWRLPTPKEALIGLIGPSSIRREIGPSHADVWLTAGEPDVPRLAVAPDDWTLIPSSIKATFRCTRR